MNGQKAGFVYVIALLLAAWQKGVSKLKPRYSIAMKIVSDKSRFS